MAQFAIETNEQWRNQENNYTSSQYLMLLFLDIGYKIRIYFQVH